MNINLSNVKGIDVISVSGRLDAETSGELAKRLSGLIDQKKFKLVLDLSGLEYISSAGLRVVLEITKKTRVSGGNLYLANIQEYVGKVLDISGLSSFLKISKSIDEAVTEIAS